MTRRKTGSESKWVGKLYKMIRKAEKHRADEMIYQEIEDAQKKTQIIKNTYWFMCLLRFYNCTGLGNQYFYQQWGKQALILNKINLGYYD